MACSLTLCHVRRFIPGTITVQPQAAPPEIEPAGPGQLCCLPIRVLYGVCAIRRPVLTMRRIGPFVEPLAIKMRCSTPGATPHWTWAASSREGPTVRSAVYSLPIQVGTTGAGIRAVCTAPDMADSDAVASAEYQLKAAEATFHPNGQTFVGATVVVLEGFSTFAKVYYTLDGSEPDLSSRLYSSGIRLTDAFTVIKAITYEPGLELSDIAISSPYIQEPDPPQIDPAGGSFVDRVFVSITSGTPGSLLHCTTDGSIADSTSPLCESPMEIIKTGTVVNAVASAHGLAASHVRSATFLIQPPPPTINPAFGAFSERAPVMLSLPSESADARFFYTLDGSDPTLSSSVTSGAVNVTITGAALRAMAVVDGMAPSRVSASGTYEIYTREPVIHASGNKLERGYGARAALSISCSTPDAKVFAFVPDGNIFVFHPEDTQACCYYDFDNLRDASFAIDKPGDYIITAWAKAPTMLESKKVSKLVSVIRRVSTPLIQPPESENPFHASITVSISSEPGSTLFYSTDGSTPTRHSDVYTGPFVLDVSATIRAFAVKNGMPDSEVSVVRLDIT